MSEENVETVKAIFRGWDEDGTEGMLRFFHEGIIYRPIDEIEAVRGHDAVREYFKRWMEPWDSFHVEPSEFLTTGAYVLNGTVVQGRGRRSGVDVEWVYWQVWLFDGGRAAQWNEYQHRVEALEAVGLSE